MTPTFLADDWCELAWSAFVPFADWRGAAFPGGAGVYRVRVAGVDRLAYVGQTGRSLRGRLGTLRNYALKPEMPFNDPHTAAPRLWAYRDADGLAFEASAAATTGTAADRFALECYLLWMYRRETGGSTLGNFGRTHPRYTAPRNRSSGVRGRRRTDGEPDHPGGPSAPPLSPAGTPGSAGWMGLAWSPPASLAAVRVRAAPGVYVVLGAGGEVVYVGQSTDLPDRLRTHARVGPWGTDAAFACAELPAGSTPAQLLEVENDLIAGYFAAAGSAPRFQFGSRTPAEVAV